MEKKEEVTSMGGAKKKNGHKYDCKCQICKNIIAKAKRGGYDKPKELSKKINGHKMDCKCCICKNMLRKKFSKKHHNMCHKTRKGGLIANEVFMLEDDGEQENKCNCSICKKNKKRILTYKKYLINGKKKLSKKRR